MNKILTTLILGSVSAGCFAQLPQPGSQRLGAVKQSKPVSGLIANVSGSKVTINVGKQAGVKVGAKMAVTHVSRVVKDPATGKPMRKIEATIGELIITSANANSAIGNFSGSTTPVVGDSVQSK